ncbi:MAG: recombinase family protein [Gammaproteobacteria bacterium]|nr:recombinase family protein [Gammaproteobacteria bacterium]MBL7003007.1 recombinase family protein [Gammaproteobacteria bacterium]
MIIGYARVSTVDQSLDMQIDALKKAGCERIYKDKASGRDFERSQLKECIKALREGDELVVWKLDRLGRSVKNLIETVQELNKNGVEFKSLTENLDTSSSGGKLVFNVFAALAEFERDLISERTKEGLEAARKRGRKGGRPKKLNAEKIKMAKKLLLDPDQTVKGVAEMLGVGRNTLYRNLNAD